MAISVYVDVSGRNYYAESTASGTVRAVAAGTWVLVGPAPSTPTTPVEQPAGDALDLAIAARVADGSSATRVALGGVAAAGGAPDASTGVKGLVRLAGVLGGTAAAPTAFGLASADALTEAIQDTVAGLLKPGPGVSLDYDDPANGLTVGATGGAGGTSTSGIALDTDGVPYLSSSGTTAVAMDTDGVPYFTA